MSDENNQGQGTVETDGRVKMNQYKTIFVVTIALVIAALTVRMNLLVDATNSETSVTAPGQPRIAVTKSEVALAAEQVILSTRGYANISDTGPWSRDQIQCFELQAEILRLDEEMRKLYDVPTTDARREEMKVIGNRIKALQADRNNLHVESDWRISLRGLTLFQIESLLRQCDRQSDAEAHKAYAHLLAFDDCDAATYHGYLETWRSVKVIDVKIDQLAHLNIDVTVRDRRREVLEDRRKDHVDTLGGYENLECIEEYIHQLSVDQLTSLLGELTNRTQSEEIGSFKTQVEGLGTRVDELTVSVNESSAGNVARIAQEVRTLRQKIGGLNVTDGLHQQDIDGLKRRVNDLTKNISAFQDRLDVDDLATKDELTALEQQLGEINTTLEAASTSRQELADRLLAGNTALTELRESAEQSQSGLVQQIVTLRAEVQKIPDYGTEVVGLKKRANAADQDRAFLRGAVRGLQNRPAPVIHHETVPRRVSHRTQPSAEDAEIDVITVDGVEYALVDPRPGLAVFVTSLTDSEGKPFDKAYKSRDGKESYVFRGGGFPKRNMQPHLRSQYHSVLHVEVK